MQHQLAILIPGAGEDQLVLQHGRNLCSILRAQREGLRGADGPNLHTSFFEV